MLPASAFVSGKPQAREVTLQDGSTHSLYFAELGDEAWQRYFRAMLSNDAGTVALARIVLVQRGFVDVDGVSVLTLEQTAQLKTFVINELYKALFSVNNPEPVKNDSAPGAQIGSGTS